MIRASVAAALLAAAAIAQTSIDWTRAPVLETRSGHAMVYDAARERVVLFGGYDRIRFPPYSDTPIPGTWEWDGTSWTQRRSAAEPAPRYFHAMAYDVARRRVVLFGGHSNSSFWEGDTWEWDGSSWTERRPVASPSPRARHAMAYDVARQRVVLFGGGYTDDTWEWDGSNWTRRQPATAPCRREHHEMAYDVARQRVVLFGGMNFSCGFPLADTWEWDGSNWIERRPVTSPPGSWRFSMAYDVARRRVVLFDGDPIVGSATTWEWDGSNWTDRRPATSPPLRVEEALAYDAARQRVVLFGGYGAGGGPGGSTPTLSDTWLWDGSSWALRQPAASPGARMEHTMAYDVARRRVVLFGGGLYTLGILAETWEWDGSRWTAQQPATGPTRGAAIYDPVRQRVVLFGGGETWDGTEPAGSGVDPGLLRPRSPAMPWRGTSPGSGPCCSAAPTTPASSRTPGNGTDRVGRAAPPE